MKAKSYQVLILYKICTETIEVFLKQLPILANIIFLFVTQNAKTSVLKVANKDIIQFLDGNYCHFDNCCELIKECFIILKVIQLNKLGLILNSSVFSNAKKTIDMFLLILFACFNIGQYASLKVFFFFVFLFGDIINPV